MNGGTNILPAVLLALGLVFSATGGPAAAQQITWRMATIAPKNSPLFRLYASSFADKVNRWSGGRLVIEPLPVDLLAHPVKLYDKVAEGSVDIAWTHPGFLVHDDPVNALFAGFPGGMAPSTFMHWTHAGGAQKLWEDYRRETMGLVSLHLGQATTDVFAHAHRPIRKAEDLRGFSLVTTGPWAEILENTFGGVVAVVPSGDILEALERRLVDGVEYGGAGANLALGFHRKARYVMFPGVQQPGSATEVIIKAEVFDALPEDLQQVLRDAARATTFSVWLALGHGDMEAMATYARLGNVLVALDAKLQNQIRVAGRAWLKRQMDQRLKAGDKRAYELYQAYVDYQARWVDTAELQFWPRGAAQ